MARYRHIEKLLDAYYHGMGQAIASLGFDLADAEAHFASLQRDLEAGHSQGIASYTASGGQQSGIGSDPTYAAVTGYAEEKAEMLEEIFRYRRVIREIDGELAERKLLQRRIKACLEALAPGR